MVNLSVVVSPGSLVLRLRGVDVRDGTVQESWRQTVAFTVQEFPPSQQSSHASNDNDVAPCVQNSSITIVTASILIEPNRHDFTRGLRSILNLGCPTVVYGDAAAAAAVSLHRQLHPQQPVELIPVSIDDLHAWRHYEALSQRATPSFCRLINWTSQHALYLAIVLLKPVWLLQSATTNSFETEKVLWLDASPRCLGFLSPPLQLDKPEFKESRGAAHIHQFGGYFVAGITSVAGVVLQSKWVNPNDLKVYALRQRKHHIHPLFLSFFISLPLSSIAHTLSS
jgi:hypothetical protein